MTRSVKGGARASYANFIGVSRAVANSAAWTTLPHLCHALYFDMRRQFNGRNNGDICAADGYLGQYGWAHSTIHKWLKLLIAHRLIVKTRQGGISYQSRITSLYAFTDESIHANASKGIAGSPPSLGYRDFKPGAKKLKRSRKKPGIVHAVDLNVHAMDLHRSTA